MKDAEIAKLTVVRFEQTCECDHFERTSMPMLSDREVRWMKGHDWRNEEIICTFLGCGCSNDKADEIEEAEMKE